VTKLSRFKKEKNEYFETIEFNSHVTNHVSFSALEAIL